VYVFTCEKVAAGPGEGLSDLSILNDLRQVGRGLHGFCKVQKVEARRPKVVDFGDKSGGDKKRHASEGLISCQPSINLSFPLSMTSRA
jgi:hypothetical protein